MVQSPAEMIVCSGPCRISVSFKLLLLPWEGPWAVGRVGGGNFTRRRSEERVGEGCGKSRL